MTSASFPPGSRWVKGKATLLAFTFLVALSLVVAACGTTAQNKGGTHTLTAICSVSGSYTQNMSPFNPNVNCGVDGLLYENLVYVNGVTGQETPMLSTSHQFSSDNLTLTFTIRQGVKWSDGQAFDANDVAFTFNLLKQFPGGGRRRSLDALHERRRHRRQHCGHQVRQARANLLPSIEGTYIVPQHLWATVGDPSKFTNTTPVGTGPMKLTSFYAQVIKYVKNPNYWQADKVKVEELDYPVVNSNATALLKMASGQADWTGIFDPAVQSSFVQKDPAHNFSYPVPVVPAQIVPNLKNPLLGQLAVRKAISAALDRQQMSVSGEAGFEPPASPTGLMPGQEAYLDAKFNGQIPAFAAADPNAAGQILTTAGFSKGSDGILPTRRATSSRSR